MPQADGTVLIDTEINTDGIKAGWKEIEAASRRAAETTNRMGMNAKSSLNKQMDSMSKLIQGYDELGEKVEDYGDQKIPTAEYVEIQKQITRAEQQMMKLIDAQERFIATGGNEDSNAYKRRQYDIEELANTIKYAEGELKALESAGKAFTLSSETEEAAAKIEKINKNLEETRAKEVQAFIEADRLKAIGDNAEVSRQDIIDLNNELIELKARQDDLRKAGLGLGFEEFDRNTQRISQINAQLREYENSLTDNTKQQKRFNKSLKDTSKSAKSGNMSLGRMLGTSILFSFVFQAISAVMTGVREGFENLAQYSTSTNRSLSMLMSSLTRLKNAFATAFAPILDVVAPILSRFIDMLSMAATAVGQLMAALTGKSTFTRAVAVQEDYAASLEDSASAAKDAEKAMEGYLSPLDEINKISTKDDDKSGGYTGPSVGQMFEEVPVNPKILALAEKIKNMFQPIIDAVARLKGPVMGFLRTIGENILWVYETILKPILTWLITSAIPRIIDILGKVLEILTIISDWWRKNVLPIVEPILTALVNLFIGVGDGIITVFDGIAEFLLGVFTGDWNRAFAGLGQIFSGFGQIVNSICNFIQTVLETFDGWLQGVFSTDWRETFGVLGDVLNGFFSGVESIWNGIKTFFTGIITFLRGAFSGDWRMAWEGVKQIFSGIWQTLVGVVKTPINTIIGLINGMISAIVSGLNAVIDRLNSLSFTIPSWVPKFGGNRFGLNLGHLTAPSIPYLASGAVIPPNAPFMAVLGDQRNGNNLEMPESLLRRIIREESGKSSGGGSYRFSAQINRRVLFDEFIAEAKLRQSATGHNPLELA